MDTPHPGDHGTFTMLTSLNDDLKLIRASTALARANAERPGHHWQRLVAKGETPEGPLELIKQYHVDLTAGVVEITETANGRETARRTMCLDDLG